MERKVSFKNEKFQKHENNILRVSTKQSISPACLRFLLSPSLEPFDKIGEIRGTHPDARNIGGQWKRGRGGKRV